jgi:hypothetical protein
VLAACALATEAVTEVWSPAVLGVSVDCRRFWPVLLGLSAILRRCLVGFGVGVSVVGGSFRLRDTRPFAGTAPKRLIPVVVATEPELSYVLGNKKLLVTHTLMIRSNCCPKNFVPKQRCWAPNFS